MSDQYLKIYYLLYTCFESKSPKFTISVFDTRLT